MTMNSELPKKMLSDQLQRLIEINGFDVFRNSLMECLEFDHTTLQKYLNNEREASLEEIVQLAYLFNTSVDYLVGNSDYILDTWEFDFLEEFFQYSSKKIKEHFKDRHNTQISSKNNIDAIIFGLITYMTFSRTGKSFEDLDKDEIANKSEAFDEIISIFHNCITMSNQDCFDITELRALNRNIVDYLFGDFSFVNERILNGLEDNVGKADIDKVLLLKDSINQNIRRSQRALKVLNKLSINEGSREDAKISST